MISDYGKACTEVIEILKLLPKYQYEKIPQKEIDYYIKNSDKEYNFKLNPDLPLSEQKILRTTYTILVTIWRDYFISDEKKNILNDILELNRKLKFPIN